MPVGLVKQDIFLLGSLHFKQAWGKKMCTSTLLQISEPFQDVESPYIPLSSHQSFQEVKPTTWHWIIFSSCSAIESNTRKVPLWLSFLISYITWHSGPPGSDQRFTFKKNTMNVKLPVREKPPQPQLKSSKSNDYYTRSKKMNLYFVWVYLLPASTHHFFCSPARMKSTLPSNTVLIQVTVRSDQPLLSLPSNMPDRGRPWRLSHVLQFLFPDLWLHIRHMLNHMLLICTQMNSQSSYELTLNILCYHLQMSLAMGPQLQ